MIILNITKGTSGFSWLFEQNCYLPQTEGIRSVKAGGGSGNIPKIIEVKNEKQENNNIFT